MVPVPIRVILVVASFFTCFDIIYGLRVNVCVCPEVGSLGYSSTPPTWLQAPVSPARRTDSNIANRADGAEDLSWIFLLYVCDALFSSSLRGTFGVIQPEP